MPGFPQTVPGRGVPSSSERGPSLRRDSILGDKEGTRRREGEAECGDRSPQTRGRGNPKSTVTGLGVPLPRPPTDPDPSPTGTYPRVSQSVTRTPQGGEVEGHGGPRTLLSVTTPIRSARSLTLGVLPRVTPDSPTGGHESGLLSTEEGEKEGFRSFSGTDDTLYHDMSTEMKGYRDSLTSDGGS